MLSGAYTLTYTDLYGSKWTTRPLRVRKTEAYTAGSDARLAWDNTAKTLTVTHTSGTFAGFLAGDRVSIVSAATELTDVLAANVAAEGWILSIETAATSLATIVLYTTSGTTATVADSAGVITLKHASHRVEHMKEALMTLPDNVIDDISVNYEGTFSSKLNTYSVTFISPHNSGDQHMLQCNAAGCDVDGCQPRFEGLSDTAATATNKPTCVVTETRKGTTEAATCSNRGNCDGSTGQCECFEGFSGIDCGLQTILV